MTLYWKSSSWLLRLTWWAHVDFLSHSKFPRIGHHQQLLHFAPDSRMGSIWRRSRIEPQPKQNLKKILFFFNFLLVRLVSYIKITLLRKIQWKQRHILYIKVVYKHDIMWSLVKSSDDKFDAKRSGQSIFLMTLRPPFINKIAASFTEKRVEMFTTSARDIISIWNVFL